jgi:hypothetical protein
MKKIFLFSVLLLSLSILTSMNKEVDNKSLVPDEITAIKIAEAIWLPIYGEKIYDKRPFVAKLKDGKVWEVTGTLNTQKGGGPYIEIRKSDCKILNVTHTK